MSFFKRSSNKYIILSITVVALIACFMAPAMAGDDLNVTPVVTKGADQTAYVIYNIEYSGTINAIGLTINLPENVEFVSANCDYPPAIAPSKGDTGALEFAWVTTPPSPFTFSYTVLAYDKVEGNIDSTVNYRRAGGPLFEEIAPISIEK